MHWKDASKHCQLFRCLECIITYLLLINSFIRFHVTPYQIHPTQWSFYVDDVLLYEFLQLHSVSNTVQHQWVLLLLLLKELHFDFHSTLFLHKFLHKFHVDLLNSVLCLHRTLRFRLNLFLNILDFSHLDFFRYQGFLDYSNLFHSSSRIHLPTPFLNNLCFLHTLHFFHKHSVHYLRNQVVYFLRFRFHVNLHFKALDLHVKFLGLGVFTHLQWLVVIKAIEWFVSLIR